MEKKASHLQKSGFRIQLLWNKKDKKMLKGKSHQFFLHFPPLNHVQNALSAVKIRPCIAEIWSQMSPKKTKTTA